MGEIRLGLKVEPTAPRDLDLKSIRVKAIEVLRKAGLREPLALSLTGSRVWGLGEQDSDIDLLAYGEYSVSRDILDYYEGRELEVTTVPIDDVRNRRLPFELRWDIVTAVPLSSEDLYITETAAKDSLLALEEVDCILSHIVYRLSWLGISPFKFNFAGINIYSYLERYKKYPKSNLLGILFYSINLVATAQYVINRLPYPFAKWRLIHLNKLWKVSPKLLEFVEKFRDDHIELNYLINVVSGSFLETLELITDVGYLKEGLLDDEECRSKMHFYPYI